jgi:heme/copper-type cytochrome/quinol oxidase subunit 3
MTFLLICSSVTMVKGLSAVKRGDMKWGTIHLLLTMGGGIVFLGLQAYEWSHLIHEGMLLTGNPWGSPLFGPTFYITTGFHGLHVTGGVLYLALTVLMLRTGKWGANEVEITGLYWHFVDLIWILVFTFIYLL